MPFDGSTNYDGLDFLKYQGTKVAPYDIGMTHTFSYKGIDLSFTFTGKFGPYSDVQDLITQDAVIFRMPNYLK